MIRSRRPAGKRPVPAVVRWLVEHCLPELVVAAVAGDEGVSHAAAAAGGFPGRCADARFPAHLRLARPQLMTERTAFRLILEQGSGHLNDHARARCPQSMIICGAQKLSPGNQSLRCHQPGLRWPARSQFTPEPAGLTPVVTGLLWLPVRVQALAVAAGAVPVPGPGPGHVPVPVAERGVALLAESCVVVEPGQVDLGEAQRRPERLGDPPRPAGGDGVAVARCK
jgi:hypothetical protein